MGGDTDTAQVRVAIWPRFQSQVAILGWGYKVNVAYIETIKTVSIAGGDSWVGIRCVSRRLAVSGLVSIAGGDSWVGILNVGNAVGVAIIVSIAGGDSWVGILPNGFPQRARVVVSIAGGDSWVGILQLMTSWRAK